MEEPTYIFIGEHTENLGKTTFIVSSFVDNNSKKTAEQLIMELLQSKVSNTEKEEKIA